MRQTPKLITGAVALALVTGALTAAPMVSFADDKAASPTTGSTVNDTAALTSSPEVVSAPNNDAAKTEVVYAKLAESGSVTGVYVVNSFIGTEGDSIVDYGMYESVVDLADNKTLAQTGSGVQFTMNGSQYSYQGNMTSTDIPWTFGIEYSLDGKSISAEELAGKSGELSVTFKTRQNASVGNGYYDNYLVQASFTIPTAVVQNLKTDDGSIAVAGSNQQINFMALPGKDSTSTWTATVTNFEMDGVSIAAIPFAMSLDMPDTNSMIAGFDELVSGTKSIADGASQLKDGVSKYQQGVSESAKGAKDLADGAQSVKAGTQDYVNGVSYTLYTILQGKGQLDTGKQAILAMIENSPTLSAQEKQQLLGAFGAYSGGVDGVFEGISTARNELEYSGNLLVGGVESVAQGTSELSTGLNQLASGGDSLTSGASELSSGTSQLASESQQIPDKVRAQIDEFIAQYDKSDYQPSSYTSSKNTHVSLVQFVMTTEPIKQATTTETPAPEPEKSIIERFFDLFK